MDFFDSHAHLDSPRFGSPALRLIRLNNADLVGVRAILIPGVKPLQWPTLPDLCTPVGALYAGPKLVFAIGIHPLALTSIPEAKDSANIAELAVWTQNLPSDMKALGETGLDFGRAGRNLSRSRQLRIFSAHLDLCRKTGLPLIVHCVAAHGPMTELLLQSPTPACVLHSFTGSAELASRYCRHGHYISFSPMITHPNVRRALESAQVVPDQLLLIESDCPDQTPYARRPDVNEPAFIVDVARALAKVRQQPLAHVAGHTFENSKRVFNMATLNS